MLLYVYNVVYLQHNKKGLGNVYQLKASVHTLLSRTSTNKDSDSLKSKSEVISDGQRLNAMFLPLYVKALRTSRIHSKKKKDDRQETCPRDTNHHVVSSKSGSSPGTEEEIVYLTWL